METSFEQFLTDETRLGRPDVSAIAAHAKERRLKRNETFLSAGEVARCKIFIKSGLLKVSTLSDSGNETIFYFFPEKSWTALDVESYDKQSPTIFHITAIEPTTLLVWNKRDFEQLLQQFPEFKKHAEAVGAQKAYLNKQRLGMALLNSAEQKYRQFLKDYAGLLSRIPLHAIAAYLNVSVKTLSRLRHAEWE